jgi:hypothetical protein
LIIRNTNFYFSVAGSSTSHITTLLTLYLQTPYKHIRDLTGKLLNQTLSDSFMFAHDSEEVQLWLNALPQNFSTSNGSSMSDTQQAVLQFLDNCISRFSKAQYKYTDQLVDLVNTVKSESSTKYTNSLARTLINGNNNTDASDYRHPFSPLLLALCENLNFIKTDRRPAVLYLTNLITILLTKQGVAFYLQHVCSKLNNECDTDQHLSPREVTEWSKTEMVHQTQLVLGQESVPNTTTTKVDYQKIEEKFTSLIKTENVENVSHCREEFMNLLDQLPVSVLGLHLEKSAAFCHRQLKWTLYEPLVNYLCLRHPLSGSIFSYRDIGHMKSLVSMEQ